MNKHFGKKQNTGERRRHPQKRSGKIHKALQVNQNAQQTDVNAHPILAQNIFHIWDFPIMQTSYVINHSHELRLALSIAATVSLFAIARLAYFIDDKLTALLKRRQATSSRRAATTTF